MACSRCHSTSTARRFGLVDRDRVAVTVIWLSLSDRDQFIQLKNLPPAPYSTQRPLRLVTRNEAGSFPGLHSPPIGPAGLSVWTCRESPHHHGRTERYGLVLSLSQLCLALGQGHVGARLPSVSLIPPPDMLIKVLRRIECR